MSNSRVFPVIIFYLFLALFLMQCGDDDNPSSPTNDLVGTWKLTQVIAITPQGTFAMTPEQAEMAITLTINSNGTYQAVVTENGMTETDNGTWSMSNHTLTIVDQNGETVNMECAFIGNNKIQVTQEEMVNGELWKMVMEFTRQ